MSKSLWVKLTNGSRTKAAQVSAVYTHEESFRIFLKNEKGDMLCSVQLDDEDAFRQELASIDEQLG